MGWFKKAKDFGDRNLVNGKIVYLKGLKSSLEHLSKIVFQSGSTAKNENFMIVSSKKITSYPTIRDILIEADSKALDSPWRFADLCKEAIDHISTQISTLIEERKELTFGHKDKPRKGWF